jgi:membrane fusion protein, heavy metal efflux system
VTRRLLWVGGIVACALFWGCHAPEQRPRASRTTGLVSLPPESREYIRVEPAAEPPSTASRSLFARVSFDERKVVTLGPPVGGRVIEVDVTTGAAVKAGQALLTIHSSDLAAINAQVAEARHSRMLAEQIAQRAALLVTQGAGSQAELEQARATLQNAREEERRAQNAQGALGGPKQGASYVLKSPIAGTVVERNVNVGSAVTAGQGTPLLTVADLSRVWVLADVFEQDLPYIRQGNEAKVSVPALRGKAFEGAVAYVSEIVDSATRTARARIEIDNPDRALLPGMFAQVQVRSPEMAAAWVPTSAVLARRDEFFVFVEEGKNSFRVRPVEVGQEEAGRIAILEGLKPGEAIVTRGAILLDAEANAAF